MGESFSYHCMKCGYTYHAVSGIGFRFPIVYRETVQDALEGKLGEKIQKFLQEHPDGAIDCESGTVYCSKCGELESTLRLNMYLPKEERKREEGDAKAGGGRWAAAAPDEGFQCVAPWDLYKTYKLFAKYPHCCKKCGSAAREIRAKTLAEKVESGAIVCPCCRGRLVRELCLTKWD